MVAKIKKAATVVLIVAGMLLFWQNRLEDLPAATQGRLRWESQESRVGFR